MPAPPTEQLPFVARWRIANRGYVWASAISVDDYKLYFWIADVVVGRFPTGAVGDGVWVEASDENREAIEQAMLRPPWNALPDGTRLLEG